MIEARVLLGKCEVKLKDLPDESVDSIATDPPYHLTAGKKGGSGPVFVNLNSPAGRSRVGTGFMGMTWDGGDIAYNVDMWKECLRVLKPGGHLLSFGGSRTYHRMACAVEDAGFEIRDQIMWIYGSGMPKSHNLHDDFEGWGCALKPAHEPIVVARKPFKDTVAKNMALHQVGAYNINASRVPGEPVPINRLESWSGFGQLKRPEYEATVNDKGRWPANIIHDGSDEVLEHFPEASGDASTHGSAARFFYCAKASRSERNAGCDLLPESDGSTQWDPTSQRGKEHLENGWGKSRNGHPTVKPVELMRYLCRLVTPPGGTVLDPFTGSGSTGVAAVREGFNFLGIEECADYLVIAEARIFHARAMVDASQPQPQLFDALT